MTHDKLSDSLFIQAALVLCGQMLLRRVFCCPENYRIPISERGNHMKINMDSILRELQAHDKKPGLYEEGNDNIWTDPHLSRGMLEAHLNEKTDAASFRPAKRLALLDFVDKQCPPKAYPSVLDLGCGPGLISQELAKRGRNVTGIDFSTRSIYYARERAMKANLQIRYIEGNYVTTDFSDDQGDGYDLAIMISFDFGVLAPEQREQLLKKVHKALRPGGVFLLDAFTTNRPTQSEHRSWETGIGGYWSEGEYLLLNHQWHYEGAINCMQSIMMDAKGLRVFHIWEHLFTPDELVREMAAAGFQASNLYADHTGAQFTHTSERMYILANK